MSETLPKCRRCGTPLPPDAPEGLCPRCLVALNLATQTDVAGETGPGGTAVNKPPPAPPLPPAEIAKLFPQLEILECLGRGGMGAVYKARQPRLDRFVALKILSPEKQDDPKFAERFEREARALARLNHPNIVTVYDFGQTQGNCYLLMEFVDGLTLRQLFHARKLSPDEALGIVPKICEALQYAHELGIVHRDIKPENILLDKKGQVKIADFGIAKIIGQTPKDASLTGAKDVVGTPHYMVPEQIEKPATVDHRADIYSLGVVFYEMLTGELPLGKFQPPSSCPGGLQIDVRLDEVVLHALEKSPERRYQQASQVKTAVETIAGTPPAQTPPIVAGKTGTGTPLFPPSLGLIFNSRLALNIARTGWVLGCLAALGFIPGLKWMLGFSGFFGLIGFAVLIESAYRLKHHVPFGGQPAERNPIPFIIAGVALILSVVLAGFVLVNVYRKPGPGETSPVTSRSTKPGLPVMDAKRQLMAQVEDFFQHNFRDVTSRNTLEWGEIAMDANGSQSIRYRYRAKIWDKDTVTNNQVFTFAPDGKFVSVKDIYGDPKQRMMALVEKFFGNNYRDITSRQTLEWGDAVTAANGNTSIRYQYRAKISGVGR